MKFIMNILATIVTYYREVVVHLGYLLVLVAALLGLAVVAIGRFIRRT